MEKRRKKRGKKRKSRISDTDSDEEFDEHPEDQEMTIDEALAMIEESKKETRRLVVNGYGKVIGYIPDHPAESRSDQSATVPLVESPSNKSVTVKREGETLSTAPNPNVMMSDAKDCKDESDEAEEEDG